MKMSGEQGDSSKLNVVRIKRKRSEQPVDNICMYRLLSSCIIIEIILVLEMPSAKKTLLDSFKSLSTHEDRPPKVHPGNWIDSHLI